jgi:hypothetical protein
MYDWLDIVWNTYLGFVDVALVIQAHKDDERSTINGAE